jgi:Cu/Zn superoxide dismutase
MLVASALVSVGCGDAADEDKKGDGTTPTATAALAPFAAGTVSGQATFVQNGSDIFLSINLSNCVPTPSPTTMPPPTDTGYPVHIHEGSSCTDETTQGPHWGPERGEGIPNIICAASGRGFGTHTRAETGANAWTIGGDPATNVVGHVLVVHQNDVPMDPPRVACGVIVDASAATP